MLQCKRARESVLIVAGKQNVCHRNEYSNICSSNFMRMQMRVQLHMPYANACATSTRKASRSRSPRREAEGDTKTGGILAGYDDSDDSDDG